MAHDQDNLQLPTRIQSKWNYKVPLSVFFKDARDVFKADSLGKEILQIAVPAAMALAADPIASLIDTAFIGRIGAVELAAVGVSIAIFNQASKITIFPLVSITTSFVAQEETASKINADQNYQDQKSQASHHDQYKHNDEDDDDDGSSKPHHHDCDDPEECLGSCTCTQKTNDKQDIMIMKAITAKNSTSDVIVSTNSSTGINDSITISCKKKNKTTKGKSSGKRHIPSASTALVLGVVLGLVQTTFIFFAANTLLQLMGIKQDSPMLAPAHRYLTLRSLGAPALLLSLAMQGVFRGLKDTKTPLYATVAADSANLILDVVLMFACHLGVSGAAIAHVISQYLMSFILLWKLTQQVDLLPPSAKDLQLSRFLKNGT